MSPPIVAFGAHPDDIELGCGGTLAALTRKGHSVVHVCLTSGEAGGRGVAPGELARVREAEAREAARRLGSREVRFCRFPDGGVSVTREMKLTLITLIRELRPETLFTHSREDHFPDHKLYGGLVLDAVLGASGPWYPECPGEPHVPRYVFGYEVWHPLSRAQTYVDITAVLALKQAALRAYRSQMVQIPYDEALEGLARYRGALGGQGTHAEAFEVIRSDFPLPP